MKKDSYDAFVDLAARKMRWRGTGHATERALYYYAKSEFLLCGLNDAYLAARARWPGCDSAELVEKLLAEGRPKRVRRMVGRLSAFLLSAAWATIEVCLMVPMCLLWRSNRHASEAKYLFVAFSGISNTTRHVQQTIAQANWPDYGVYRMGFMLQSLVRYGSEALGQLPSVFGCLSAWRRAVVALWRFYGAVAPSFPLIDRHSLFIHLFKAGGRFYRGFVHIEAVRRRGDNYEVVIFGLQGLEGFILDEYFQANGVATVHALHANITSFLNLSGFSDLAITRAETDVEDLRQASEYKTIVNGHRDGFLKNMPEPRPLKAGSVLVASTILHQSRYSSAKRQKKEFTDYFTTVKEFAALAGLRKILWRPHPHERIVLGVTGLRLHCWRYGLELDDSPDFGLAVSKVDYVLITPSAVWTDCLRVGVVPWVYTNLFFERVGVMRTVPSAMEVRTAREMFDSWQKGSVSYHKVLAEAWLTCAADRAFVLNPNFLQRYLPPASQEVVESTSSAQAGQALRVAVAWAQYGPYHFSRVKALWDAFGQRNVTAVEFASKTATYAWKRKTGAARGIVTLIDGRAVEEVSATRLFFEAYRVFCNKRVDVVFVPSYWPATSLAVFLAAYCAGARTVMMNESHAHTSRASGIGLRLKRKLVAAFDAALVGGRIHREYFRSLGMGNERIFEGYDAVDNEYFVACSDKVRRAERSLREQYRLPKRYFINIGRMEHKKSLDTLVKAYALARLSSPSLPRLVLVGSGRTEAALRQQCVAEGMSFADMSSAGPGCSPTVTDADVLFYGFRQLDELPIFYTLSTAFILPSLWEEWGLVVNEAMACGVPVIVSKVAGCAPDLVVHGETGFTFTPGDATELARCLLDISNDEHAAERMGQNARALVRSWGLDNFAANALSAAHAAMKNHE